MEQHNIYLQESGDRKVIIVAVVEKASLPEMYSDQMFVGGTISSSIYTNNNPQIIMDWRMALSGEKFCDHLGLPPVRGMGIQGIITSPVWYSKKTRSILDQMGG